MTINTGQVNTDWEQLPMFPSGGVKLTLECLIDHEDESVLFVVEAREGAQGPLLALFSTSPKHFAEGDKELLRAFAELSRIFRDFTGPF